MEGLLGHRRPKGPATDKPTSCNYRATSRLYHWRGVLIQEGRWEPARMPKVKHATSRLEAVSLQFARVAVSEAPMAPYIVRLQLGNGRRAEIELRQVEPLLQLIAAMERQP